MIRQLIARRIVPSLLAVVFVAGSICLVPRTAYASADSTLSGYAWSSTIGWISFKGANYGVEVNSGGNLSGYAWSSNIGWISFNENSGCPESGCTTQPRINPSSGVVSGWAKATAADGNGWDGWIKLGGSWAQSVVFSENAATGYSWGSDVVGWVSWDGVTKTGCTNGANNYPDCDTCTPPLEWDGGSSSCITPPAPCPLPWGGSIASGVSVQAFLESSVVSPATCTQQTRTCTDGSLSGSYTNQTCTVLTPSVTISANPSRVQSGSPTFITWSSDGVDDCTITGTNGFSRTGTSGEDVETAPITSQTVFTANCDIDAATDSAIVNIVPAFQEF